MIEYNEFQYLFPPRPETKISKTLLGFYEQRGWFAQAKKNGTCTMVFARGNEVIFKTRHPEIENGDHRMWQPKADHIKFFAGSKNWNVFTAELLHSKVTGGPKDELYIFDQLVYDGEYLIGSTFAERQQLLNEEFSGDDEGDQIRIDKRVTLAKCINTGFEERFAHLKPEDEGLVLKDPRATLARCSKMNSNAGWQAKCRIPHKNYSF
jgi:hypothetical protein